VIQELGIQELEFRGIPGVPAVLSRSLDKKGARSLTVRENAALVHREIPTPYADWPPTSIHTNRIRITTPIAAWSFPTKGAFQPVMLGVAREVS
jgi:hypothetical protein